MGEEALTEIALVRKDHPDDPWVSRQTGFVLIGQGKDAEALPELEKSLQADPQQPKVWHALLEAYRRTGRSNDMRRAYERLLALDRSRAEAAYRDNILPLEAMGGGR